MLRAIGHVIIMQWVRGSELSKTFRRRRNSNGDKQDADVYAIRVGISGYRTPEKRSKRIRCAVVRGPRRLDRGNPQPVGEDQPGTGTGRKEAGGRAEEGRTSGEGTGGRYPAKEKNVVRVLGQRRGRVDFSRSVAASADGGNDHDDGTAVGAATSTTGVFHAAAAAAQHHDAAGVGQRARSGC